MNWLAQILRRRLLERELSEEIRGHLQQRVDELVETGMPRDAASARARREFGNVARIEEEGRDVWRWGWIEDLFADVRFAFRQLRRTPAFAAAGALTLALGVGANTAVFGVVDAVLLRPLPFPESDRLLSVLPRSADRIGGSFSYSYPNFFDLRRENTVFDHVVSYRSTAPSLTGFGEPTQLRGAIVSWDLFPALRIQPLLGRGFEPGEEDPAARAAVVSYTLWKTTLGADPGVVGRTIHLNREPFTVVGVAPQGFRFPLDGPEIEIWTTLATDARSATLQPMTRQRGARVISVIGRLRDGVTMEQAQSQLAGVAASLVERYPNDNRRYPGIHLQPAHETLVGTSREPLLLLFAAVGLVLLLACANIANLLLSRTAEREREFALRAAIGAGRSRIVRQVIGESLTLSLLGCAGGVVAAAVLLRVVVPLAAGAIPRITDAGVDARVLSFSVALAALTAVLFSLAPFARLRGGTVSETLQYGSRASAGGADRLRSVIVVAQVAIGLVLMSGAGLLTASYVHLTRRDPGFEPARLLTFSVNLPGSVYPGPKQLEFYDRLIERLRATPGVTSAAAGMPLPLTGSSMRIGFDIEQRPAPPHARPTANVAIVSPGFFETTGIPLVQGRSFTGHDDLASHPVVIVNRAFAEQFFPGENAIGKRIRSGATGDARGPLMREIVGIVGNARQSPVGLQPDPIYYLAQRQMPWCCPSVIVRAAGAPSAVEADVRATVASVDRWLSLFDVRTGDGLLAIGVTAPRFLMTLLGGFAVIGLLLTAVGLYGVLNYAVVKQTREIGVRMALGATRTDVVGMVLRKALLLVAAGTVIGIAGSLASTRLIGSLLFGVEGRTPSLLAVATAVILAAAVCAAYVPARRAASIDPTVALRSE